MSDELEKLLNVAKAHELTATEREEQRRSFAYGNANIENPDVTRDTVNREAEILGEPRRSAAAKR